MGCVVQYIRASSRRTTVTAVILILFAFFGSGNVASALRHSFDWELVFNTLFGLGVTLIGLMLFGSKPMGLSIPSAGKHDIENILLPLAAILLLNAFGKPLILADPSKLQIPQIVSTGFWEEVFFRGFALAWWIRVIGIDTKPRLISYVLTSSVAFGLAHIGQGGDLFLLRTGLGILLAVLTIQTHTLVFAFVLHALNNGLVDVLGGNVDTSVKLFAIAILCSISVTIALRSERAATYPRAIIAANSF